MALNTFKCKCVTPLHFKGLTGYPSFVYILNCIYRQWLIKIFVKATHSIGCQQNNAKSQKNNMKRVFCTVFHLLISQSASYRTYYIHAVRSYP